MVRVDKLQIFNIVRLKDCNDNGNEFDMVMGINMAPETINVTHKRENIPISKVEFVLLNRDILSCVRMVYNESFDAYYYEGFMLKQYGNQYILSKMVESVGFVDIAKIQFLHELKNMFVLLGEVPPFIEIDRLNSLKTLRRIG